MSGGGLVEVLREHGEDHAFPDTCLCETIASPSQVGHYAEHLEAAVLAWVAERLDGAREAVGAEVWESIRESNYLGDTADGDAAADAALTAVREALIGSQDATTADLSDDGHASGQGDHHEGERLPGGGDGGGDV